MDTGPDLKEQYRRLEEIIRALRNQEVDTVIGTKGIFMLRVKETEDALREQYRWLESLLAERTKLVEHLQAQQELLERQGEHLEQLVEERTAELRRLSHRLIDVQEKERNLIGIELHDQIGQYLTYTTLLIDQMARKHESQELTNARMAVQEAIGKIRNLSALLSPRLLRSDGLLIALDSFVEEYTRNTRIEVDFIHEEALHDLPNDVALACYRIIQESFTNVARHAKPGKVELRLSSRKHSVHLEVADDGAGFDPQRTEHSTGLTGMRERALALNGVLTIETGLGRGTRVSADIPFTIEETQ